MVPKFMAWDKKYKMIMTVNEIDFEKNTVWLETDNGDHENRHTLTRDFDEVVLMQSTGLKDKNGVEIFEGDIVRHSEVATDISIVRFGEFGVPNIEEQSYQDCAVGFYYENASEFKDIEPFNMTVPLNSDYVKGVLVIGNIHENPELLSSGIE